MQSVKQDHAVVHRGYKRSFRTEWVTSSAQQVSISIREMLPIATMKNDPMVPVIYTMSAGDDAHLACRMYVVQKRYCSFTLHTMRACLRRSIDNPSAEMIVMSVPLRPLCRYLWDTTGLHFGRPAAFASVSHLRTQSQTSAPDRVPGMPTNEVV